jgi:hypothetical protein
LGLILKLGDAPEPKNTQSFAFVRSISGATEESANFNLFFDLDGNYLFDLDLFFDLNGYDYLFFNHGRLGLAGAYQAKDKQRREDN